MTQTELTTRSTKCPRSLVLSLSGKELCRLGRIVWAMAARFSEIALSAEERGELERVAALQKAPHRDVQRAKLVLYAAAGLSNVEIAGRLDMSAKNVGRWRRRFCEERLEGLKDRVRGGRPRRFPPSPDRRGQGRRLRAAGRGRAALASLDG
jgi:DNA-binding CsgD family transcriptional regulator